MSRSSRQKEKYGNGDELSGATVHDGTAARTRPFSFDEIMIRRKNKKVSADGKDQARDPGNLSRQDTVETFSDHLENDRGNRRGKDSAYVVEKKASEDTTKRGFRKEEATALKESSPVKSGGKESHGSETNLKDKLDNEAGRARESKNEKQSHHRSRNEERLRDDKDKGRTKESKVEKQSHHRSRNEELTRDGDDMGRARERRNEKQSHHRDRDEERPRDDRETRKKQHPGDDKVDRKKHSETLVRRDRYIDSDTVKSERESKSKRRSREEGKDRLETVGYVVKKHDSGKQNLEPVERKDRMKDSSKSHYDGPEQKRRRSGSRELRPRDRSTSLSPRVHKRTYDGREHGESSLHSSNERRQHSDVDRNRVSNNGGHTSNHGWRHGGRGSRLGGYSPRKRRSEAAIRTPSPSPRSPERKSAGWDLPPVGTGSILAGTSSDFQSLNQIVSTDRERESFDATYLRSIVVTIHVAGFQTVAIFMQTPAYLCFIIEIPCFQTVAIFMQTGVPEKSVPAVDATSDIVKDSPHKIFIGGISKDLSSDMLLEIVSSFGHLKAYRFQVNEDLKEPCAFLEYMDQTITLKACAGLNGMKLAGQVLTAVQAFPDASVEENSKSLFYGIPEHAKPLLLEPTKVLKLKNVFNPADLSSLSGSELEETLEDIRIECARFGTVKSINIVRCESIHATESQAVVITNQTDAGVLQDREGDSATKNTQTLDQDISHNCEQIPAAPANMKEPLEDVGDSKGEGESTTKSPETLEQHTNHNSGENSTTEAPNIVKEPLEDGGDFKGDRPSGDKAEVLTKTGVCELYSSLVTDVPAYDLDTDVNPQEVLSLHDTRKDEFINGADHIQNEDASMNDSILVEEELKQEEANDELQEASVQLHQAVGEESKTSEREESKQLVSFDEHFEHGTVLVEYVRTEASVMAAHCLHRRPYGDRIVLVSYIPHDLYISRFPK
ncbi:hypothetical protein IFM89_007538 [Coptis chinensis]|uniref:RRM domain-containing protein n=1 Tax=Coptis chinensis TaxID=261450 RepID=A0A835LX16_9MAGN|nr:hypothetical protein IFM89_007538 [Coptis chinensis]